jgi:hypothetical protein
MQRKVMILAMLAVFALPVTVQADETVIPPEADWTATPPARRTVDANQLAALFVEKGMITQQDYAQLTRAPLSRPLVQHRDTARPFDDRDRHRVLTRR